MRTFINIVILFLLISFCTKNQYSVIGLSSGYNFLWYNTVGNFLHKLEDSTYVKGKWIHNDSKYNQLLDSLIRFDKPLTGYPLERFDTRIFIIKNQKDSLFISSMMILEYNETYYEIDVNMGLRFFKMYYDSQGEFTY